MLTTDTQTLQCYKQPRSAKLRLDKIIYPAPVDKSKFALRKTGGSIKYGLPAREEFCKRCIVLNQRPNSTVEYQHTKDTKKKTIDFDEEGICDDFHYYTTGVKFGLGRASYDAAQEILSGDIDRDQGVALVKRFDHEFPERFADEIFRYLSVPPEEFPEASQMFEQPIMDREYFSQLADTFRSPHLWQWDNRTWSLRDTIWNENSHE